MAIYQLKTFADIIAAIREEMKIPSTDTTTINRIKRDINMVYLNEVVPFEKWDWLRGNLDVALEPRISGTVSVVQGERTVTLSSAIAKSVQGYWFSLDSQLERYRVYSHAAGSTTLVLETPFSGSTNSAAAYQIWTDRVNLPSNVRETIEITTDLSSIPLEGCGLQKLRKYSNTLPKAESYPRYYTLGDFVNPDPYSAITGLPAATSRNSSGLTKTLTFASDVSAYISINDRIRVVSAGSDAYNGEWIVSSVSSASISFTGVVNLQESVSTDTAYVVTMHDQETVESRFRELLVYPAVYNSRVIIHVDYIKEALPLENDSDEPVIPIQDRIILVYGALAKAWPRERNPEEGARNQGLFDRKLSKMSGKLDDSTDTPILRPSRTYLGTKRSGSFSRNTPGSNMFGWGGGSGANVVTGTASRVAVFNSSGELAADASIDLTELSYLNDITPPTTVALSDNQASAAEITTYLSSFNGAIMDYTISRGTGNRQVGSFIIATDGSSIASNDSSVTLGTTGVTLSAVISGSNVSIRYTSTSTGAAPSIEYSIRKW